MRPLLMLMVVATTAGAETLTVEDAVHRVLDGNAQVLAARARRDAADDLSRSVRGQLLPAVSVSDELQHYSGPFTVALAVPGAPVSPSINVRDQNTNTLALGVKQPVVGLLRLSQELVAANENAEAAGAQLAAMERGLREAVETGFLRLFEARAAKDVAHAAQVQLGEQLTLAKARVEAGALTTADVLRVQVARANLHQQELQAEVQESAARTQVLVLLGLPLDGDWEFAEPVALEAEAQTPVPTVAAATTRAVAERPELAQQLHLLDSAAATARARLFALLPEIDLTASWVRVDGQALAQREAASIGVRASWPVWLWGTQWYAHRAAVHQAEAARRSHEDAQQQVRGEVTGRMEQLRAATSAIEVAQTALESAEEAWRVTSAVVQAGSGTTTDLLDAQSALTQAKLNLVRARYQQALARVQLRRSMGG